MLCRGFSEDEARQQLRIAIYWGRYGELFDFDANTGQFTLEPARHEDGLADRSAQARGWLAQMQATGWPSTGRRDHQQVGAVAQGTGRSVGKGRVDHGASAQFGSAARRRLYRRMAQR